MNECAGFQGIFRGLGGLRIGVKVRMTSDVDPNNGTGTGIERV